MKLSLVVPCFNEEENVQRFYNEVKEAYKNGKLSESFGTGTAAVISPVGEYIDGDEHLIINDSKIGPVAQFLYDELTGIQWGKKEDKNNWIVKVN